MFFINDIFLAQILQFFFPPIATSSRVMVDAVVFESAIRIWLHWSQSCLLNLEEHSALLNLHGLLIGRCFNKEESLKEKVSEPIVHAFSSVYKFLQEMLIGIVGV